MPKNKTENNTVEIKMDTLDIQTDIIIPGIKLKFLSTKKNEHGTNILFQTLGEQQLQYIFTFAKESIKIPIRKYYEKCYLKANQKKIYQYVIGQYDKAQDGEIDTVGFEKNILILWI